MNLSIVLFLGAAVAPPTWTGTVDQDATVLVPFYEGISLRSPAATLREVGMTSLRLGYPGVLSVPFVAWRRANDRWQVAYVEALGAAPAELEVQVRGPAVALTLRSLAGLPIRTTEVAGDLPALASALRARWDVRGSGARLADRFQRVHFYVHQFVPSAGPPALKVDWELPALVQQMKREAPGTLAFVYGFDPSGVDLAGAYFWSQGATAKVRAVLGANRRIAHLSWLNLRTWKRAIPRLGIERPVTDEVKAMLKSYPPGTQAPGGQYASKSLDACLASAGWQRSRLEQLDRLADLGFQVLQIDEFPIPAVWHHAPCQATTHLHRPGDIADEWRQIDRFLQTLAARAKARGVLLTCEEPSAALLPYVAGYIDRQFNDSIDLYRRFRKSGGARVIPLFSALFGALVTPYTDADEAEPARRPPAGWLVQHKLYAGGQGRRGIRTMDQPRRASPRDTSR
jgi:hypothetical protein